MRNFLLFFLFLTISSLAINAETTIPCDLEMAEIGKGGDVVVKLWSYTKSRIVSDETIISNAIIGICFKGVAANEQRRMRGIKPLIEGSYDDYKDYFDQLLKAPDSKRFVRIGMNGYAEQGDVIKLKKQYKVGRLVIIHLSELRKQLEDDQIIKGLTYGF